MKDQKGPITKEERREFLKQAGKASLSVPATALVLSVANKRSHATGWGYGDGDGDGDSWGGDSGSD